jgi:RNA polymerase sigma factor (TIGR02999 family)
MLTVAMSDVTQILQQIESGDPSAADQLLPLIYDELRKLAAARMASESPDQTLQPTALVHEAYLRLVQQDQPRRWDGRGHFFAAAAEAMRRILVENARRHAAVKRGGGRQRHDVQQVDPADDVGDVNVLALDEALERLATAHPRKAELVKLRYFAGLTHQDASAYLGISTATADRDWAYAKAWLHRELSRTEPVTGDANPSADNSGN